MPQIQFIHRRKVFQLWRRDKYPQCMLHSSRCSSWTRFLTCPLWCFDRMVQKSEVLPQLQSIAGRRHSLSFRRGRSQWSSLFSRPQRFHYCCSITGGRSLLCGSCRFSNAAVETTLALPQLQFNHRFCGSDCRKLRKLRSCCSSLVVDFPVVVQRPRPMVFCSEDN